MNKRFWVSAAAVILLASGSTMAAKARWVSYTSNLLGLKVSVPSDWSPAKIPNALAFRYDDQVGGNAAVGILKSSRNSSIEEAADQEFAIEGHPDDWTRSPARVDGMRAIKIVGTLAKDPNQKMVHYYVETPKGIYLVQCQAPQEQWSTYSPIFAAILTRLKFVP